MEDKLDELKARLVEYKNLESAAWVLSWDQQTYMPAGGAEARGRQVATLERLAHETLTDPAIGTLLDDLHPWAETLPYDSDDASLVRVTRREYERQARLPSEFVARLAAHQARSYAAWAEARPQNDFARVRPFLERTLDLSRELSEYYPGYEHIADPLIDRNDFGVKASTLRQLFAQLRNQLAPLVEAITAQPAPDDHFLRRSFPSEKQQAFFLDVVQAFGFDLNRGRQDVSPHPFTTNFSIDDVRFTVRFQEHDPKDALFSAFHEAGHAMYEQGIAQALEATTLAMGTSAGVHESQSRLWENRVGRSRPFWTHYYPKLQALFPAQLGDVALESFYRAVNKVERSLIRTDADEVTYGLHIILRFDLELRLLEGSLTVRDLPEAWREGMRATLGIVPPDDRDGVLQDVHWYAGCIGGHFQGYALGNLLGAQFYAAALQAHPEIPAEMEQGHFGTLHGWLKEQIYQHGSKYTTAELLERVTGSQLLVEPYIDYIKAKYGEIYQI